MANAGHAACQTNQIEIRKFDGVEVFQIEIADTPRKQAKGLMFRRAMAKDAGMLFVYETPRRAVFWMKNTLIPLDMIFIDSRGRIKTIAPNARPLDESRIDGGRGVSMILEINGGLSKSMGFRVGDVIRHPLLDQSSAVWPCNP